MNIDFLNSILFFFLILSIFIYYLIYTNRSKIGDILKTNDIPDYNRKIHKESTPRTGTYSFVIVLCTLIISNLFFKFLEYDYVLIIFASILAFLIGFFDDKYEIKPMQKILLISIISILIVNFSENLIITKVYLSTFDTFFYLNQFSIPFTILCILLLTNAMNLIDGINGIAITIFFNYFIYLLIIGKSDSLIFISYITLTNLILIFYHNFKGKHFLGDAGVLMLSTLLGLLIIKTNNENINIPNTRYSAEQFFIILMLPGLDMFRLFLERLSKKKNPFTADNLHFHHYLIKKMSLKKTLLFYLILINIPYILSYNYIYKQINIIIFSIILYLILVIYLKTYAKN